MLLTNYRRDGAGQSRALGGQLSPVLGLDLARWNTFYVGDNDIVSVTDRMSQPAQGLRPPYSLVLAPKEGGMSMYSAGTASLTAAQVAGLFATADLTGIGIISDAAMGLTVEMVAALVGSGSLTASVIGQLEAIASLAGSGSVTAAMSALAGMVADLAGTGVISDAQQEALGQMVANIYVNQSEATVDQIVEGVVDGIGSITATIPDLLNTETGDIIIPLA